VAESGERQEGPPATAGPPSPAAAAEPAAPPQPIDPQQGGIPPGRVQEFPEAGGAIKPGTGSIQDDLDRHFSRLQGYFGGALLLLLGLAIVFVAILYATKRWTSLDPADIRDYGALIVGPLITLVASVVGFYFGERRRG
jgi:hypothetical protein